MSSSMRMYVPMLRTNRHNLSPEYNGGSQVQEAVTGSLLPFALFRISRPHTGRWILHFPEVGCTFFLRFVLYVTSHSFFKSFILQSLVLKSFVFSFETPIPREHALRRHSLWEHQSKMSSVKAGL